MVTLLTIGETMGVAATTPGNPLRTATELRLSTAGAEATVAIGMQRLGHSAAWVGTLGADEIGRRVIRELRAEGVDTSYIRTIPDAKTGFMLRDRRTPDFTSVDYYRAGLAGSHLCPTDVDAAFAGVGEVSVLHVTGITAVLSSSCRAAVQRAIELAKRCGATVSFDVNYRRTLATPEQASSDAHELVPLADVLFVGDDEMHLLTDEAVPDAAVRALAALGPAEVILKRGVDGAHALDAAGGDIARTKALPVAVADVIGAGDGFVAGYLAARCHGLGIVDRLSWATACAARTVGTHGDWEGLPSRAELDVRVGAGYTMR
jgi:2-dehydro-3-deoxygluconokinase